MELCTGGSDASDEYISRPFTSHKEYVEVLLAVTMAHSELMRRRGKGERELGDVIKDGAAYKHYVYLQNGAIFASQQPAVVRELMPTGATSKGGFIFLACEDWCAKLGGNSF